MEHERCYVYTPPEAEDRPSKRQRTSKAGSEPQLESRLAVFRDIWAQQEERIQVTLTSCALNRSDVIDILQATLEEADSATQEKIVNFVAESAPAQDGYQTIIPTGLVVAGPSIASHGPFFRRLGQRIKDQTNSAYTVVTSGESPNLKSFLKNVIKKITSRMEDYEDEDHPRAASARKGPKILDFDLGHVREWQRKHQVSSIVIAIQDSEAFDTAMLVEIVELFQ